MIIIGYDAIAAEKFSKITSLEEIDATQGLVWFEASKDAEHILALHCLQNSLAYAVRITSIKELLIYANLGAKYVILQRSPEQYQKIAETYLLDTKILYVIKSIEEIEELARMGIDGVIFEKVFLNTPS